MSTPVVGFLKFMFFGLIPPEKPDGESTPEACARYRKAKRRWAQFVAVSLWVGFVALLALLLPTYGLWPEKYDRVAWGADIQAQVSPVVAQVAGVESKVADVDKKTDRLLVKAIRDELRATRGKQCRAIAAGDAERKRDLAEDLEELQDEYKEMKKEAWDVPPCDEL